jgi:Transposase DDE domain
MRTEGIDFKQCSNAFLKCSHPQKLPGVGRFSVALQCGRDSFARQVARWIDEAVLDRMETRLKANPEILRQRREIVEHPFGGIKQWMNQGAFLMRGLVKVRAEFSLTALAYNMTRVLTIVGIERLLKAFQNATNHPLSSSLYLRTDRVFTRSGSFSQSIEGGCAGWPNVIVAYRPRS